MPNQYDSELITLAEKLARKDKIDKMMQDLQARRKEASDRALSLKSQMHNEQRDVEQLEGRSLYSLWHGLLGNKEEKLSVEREEALAARVKYEAAQRELEDIEYEISQLFEEKRGISSAEKRYHELFSQKKAALAQSNTPQSERILSLEQTLGRLNAQQKEVREALLAADSCLSLIGDIERSLDKAQGWATWDLISDGGIITQVAKHGHLDDAQGMIEELQRRLGRLRTELADVQQVESLYAKVEGFTRFADWFFDGLIVDWHVRSKIKNSQSEVGKTRSDVSQVKSRLKRLLDQTLSERERAQRELDQLVLKG